MAVFVPAVLVGTVSVTLSVRGIFVTDIKFTAFAGRQFFDVNAIFPHGVGLVEKLGVLHMCARDVKRFRDNGVGGVGGPQGAVSGGDVVDFVSAASVAVLGDVALQLFKNRVEKLERNVADGKFDVQVLE